MGATTCERCGAVSQSTFKICRCHTPGASEAMTAERRVQHIRDNYKRWGEAALERACGDLFAHIDAQAAEIAALKAELATAREGLKKSVELQSHYALLLNGYDGGRRMQFATPEKWLARLAALKGPTP